MYAIIETGGRQFSISEGDLIKVPHLDGEPGTTRELDKILMIAGENEPLIGKPYIDGAKVEAEVVTHGLDRKISVFKFKRRTKYRKLTGHRQKYTELKIGKIVVP